MRIISGKYKRTTLISLDGDDITRPTKDMVKEAFFDAIQFKEGESLLDLFSGSGAIGIEAISRGGKNIVFNDINKEAIKIINTNLNKINEKSLVLNLNYDLCLKNINGKKFDYIYVDPPYAFKDYEYIFELINENNLLNKEGIIVLEIDAKREIKEEILSFKKFKDKKYGICRLLYYRRNDND